MVIVIVTEVLVVLLSWSP